MRLTARAKRCVRPHSASTGGAVAFSGCSKTALNSILAQVEHGVEDGFLVRKVAVEGAEAQVRCLGDTGDRRGFVPLLAEQAAGSGDEGVAIPGTLARHARN